MRCAANQPFLREAHIEQKSPRPRPPGQCLTTRDCPYLAQCTELPGITGSDTTPQCPLSIRVPRLVTDVASSKQPRLRSDKPLPPTRRAAAIGAGCPVLCCAVLCCAVLCCAGRRCITAGDAVPAFWHQTVSNALKINHLRSVRDLHEEQFVHYCNATPLAGEQLCTGQPNSSRCIP